MLAAFAISFIILCCILFAGCVFSAIEESSTYLWISTIVGVILGILTFIYMINHPVEEQNQPSIKLNDTTNISSIDSIKPINAVITRFKWDY